MKTYSKENKHCAFSDLIYFNNKYYLCFREGKEHMFSKGKIIVLSSEDGILWGKEVESFAINDIRDPRFIIINKKLNILINYQQVKRQKVYSQTLFCWDMGKRYRPIDKNSFATFVSNATIFSYDPVKGGNNKLINLGIKKPMPLPSFPDSTEGTYFIAQGRYHILVRRDEGFSYLLMSNLTGGFSIWSPNARWHCPLFFEYNKQMYLLARKTSKNYKNSECLLYKVDVDQNTLCILKIKKLKAFGDCGYFGYANGLISYHSSYDKKEKSKTAIFTEDIKALLK